MKNKHFTNALISNVSTTLNLIKQKKYNSIIPCGITDKGVTNLKNIKDQNYNDLENELIKNFISNLNN